MLAYKTGEHVRRRKTQRQTKKGWQDGGERRPGDAAEIRGGDGRGQGGDPGAARQRRSRLKRPRGHKPSDHLLSPRGKGSSLPT